MPETDIDWPSGWDRTPPGERERNNRFDTGLRQSIDDLVDELDRSHAEALEDAAVSLAEDIMNGRQYGFDKDASRENAAELDDAITALQEGLNDDDGSGEQAPQEEWEEHNESFNYDAPDGPPDTWSSEEYTELHDRLIGQRTEWYCQYCSTSPFSRLEKARRHVGKQHGDHLYQKYGGSDE
ncbi:alkaline phosphatase family protein [Halorussus marinus]|uniref:alkaline phosphatase family protein n=1 Tax=Halorussus marinus TaxID=2505976 RepID=UPI0010918C9E|nr:alkaline phosphatase family protein [Halorussus marinus]